MTIITLLLTPLISRLTGPVYKFFGRWIQSVPMEPLNFPKSNLWDHFVIAGGGRVGRYIASILQRMEIPLVVVEYDFVRVDELKASGFPVLYGDAEKEIILEASDIDKAKLLLQLRRPSRLFQAQSWPKRES